MVTKPKQEAINKLIDILENKMVDCEFYNFVNSIFSPSRSQILTHMIPFIKNTGFTLHNINSLIKAWEEKIFLPSFAFNDKCIYLQSDKRVGIYYHQPTMSLVKIGINNPNHIIFRREHIYDYLTKHNETDDIYRSLLRRNLLNIDICCGCGMPISKLKNYTDLSSTLTSKRRKELDYSCWWGKYICKHCQKLRNKGKK